MFCESNKDKSLSKKKYLSFKGSGEAEATTILPLLWGTIIYIAIPSVTVNRDGNKISILVMESG